MKRLLAALLIALPLSAASTVSGGVLLTQTNANQLASWLGQGDLAFTDIFSQTPTANGSILFHAAVDGEGSTFTLIQTSLGLLGGYDPLSWNSSSTYDIDPTNTGRTGFIFDLSTTTMLTQRFNDPNGQYQTYNGSTYGPSFGGGFDLAAWSSDLSSGYVYSFSYGNGFGGINLLGALNNGTAESFTVSRVETYTFTQLTQITTPEPSTALLFAAALAALGFCRRRTAGARQR